MYETEIGKKYGFLTVKKATIDDKGRPALFCECDCGNTKIVNIADLHAGRITTCGRQCKLKNLRKKNFIDLTGKKFGRLTALKLSEQKSADHNKTMWECQCECGNQCIVKGIDLRKGKTQSCGCLHKETMQAINTTHYIGEKINFLTIIEKLYDENHTIKWKCKCELCGNIRILSAQELKPSKAYLSCGCLKSYNEIKINNFLKEKNISFKKEQSFNDLLSQNNYPLRYDFALYKENKIIGLIEYQGEQHFKPIPKFGGQNAFQKLQEHDQLKYEYAQNHCIPILYLTKEDNLKEKIDIFLNSILERK